MSTEHASFHHRYEHQEPLFDFVDESEKLSHYYEYKQLDTPELRQQYVHYTERLIAEALENKTDTMVFLDKSARPVAWLMKSLWPTLGVDEDGPKPMPEIKFANIDREQWGPTMGRMEDREGGIDINRVHPEYINDLRALFAKETIEKERLSEDFETMFDDKEVMIVDEVSASGDTLRMARKLMEAAFPKARFEARHWMPPEQQYDPKSGGYRNKNLPVWYRKNDVTGRLVGNRSVGVSEQSDSSRQYRGAMFLSTRFSEVDEKGVQLKKEMQQLGREVADGLIPVVPSRSRSEDIDRFMLRVNHIDTDEFVKLRKSAGDDNSEFIRSFVEYKRDKLAQDK